jgi:hypothetical protein
MTTPPSPEEGENPYLAYAYHDFHGIVRRFCRFTVLGWVIVAVGVGWLVFEGAGAGGTLARYLLAVSVVLAGVAVVAINVGALESYLRIPFPLPPGDPHAERLAGLLRDVQDGGWRDACAVRHTLERLEADEGFPPLR